MRNAAVLFGLFCLLSCGGLKPRRRDPKGDRGKYDRFAITIYSGFDRVETEFLKGDCSKGNTPDMVAYCEGKWSAIKDPDLIALSRGTDDNACMKIKHADLQMYCRTSYSKYGWLSWCDKIQGKGMRELCQRLNRTLPPGESGYADGGGGAPAEAEDCVPTGQEKGGRDVCCSGKTRYVGMKVLCCETGDSDDCG